MDGSLTYTRRDGWTSFELVLPPARHDQIHLEAPVYLPDLDVGPASATG
jgi:hypothetical protein